MFFRPITFKNGLFEVQDAGSQAIAPALDVHPGMRVIDACAGAGGKTLHLAALMQNQGRLIAMDVEEWKLDELRRRARRNGVSNVETRRYRRQRPLNAFARVPTVFCWMCLAQVWAFYVGIPILNGKSNPNF
jgi:16S rRNA C967 or C1407 C5-methylase (RsmB/RsmF family)